MAVDTEFKVLSFVPRYVSSAVDLSNSVYKRARSFVPAVVEPYVASAEGKVASLAAPVVARASDAGERALRALDNQVDMVVNTSAKAVGTGRSHLASSVGYAKGVHAEQARHFAAARDSYLAQVESTADWAKAKLNPMPYVDAAHAALKAAVAKAREATENPDVAVDEVHKAWLMFASVAPVATLLKITEPYSAYSLDRYAKLHGYVTAAPLYRKAYDTSASALESPLLRKAYGLVAPVAEPVAARLRKSKYAAALAEHIKPTAIAA